MLYIHQRHDWPNFTWNHAVLLTRLGMVRHLQGKLIGKMSSLGFVLQQEAELETLTLDVLKSTEIEGEFLNPEQVRSLQQRASCGGHLTAFKIPPYQTAQSTSASVQTPRVKYTF